MPHTILSVLTRENPTPYPWNIKPAPNTIGRNWLDFENWKPWSEFNYAKLRTIYKSLVDAPWNNPPDKIDWSTLDLTYGDEDGFEQQVLSRETIPTINHALRHVQKLTKNPQLHLGRRGRCSYEGDDRLNPDWAMIKESEIFQHDGSFASIMPGDTKLSARWQSDSPNPLQWKRPIQQVLTYSNNVQCRYGFIITDNELVVLQFARESLGPGIANSRGTRTPQASTTHQRVQSDDSQLTSSVQAMSISVESAGAQLYVDSGNNREYQDPKYQIIPWISKGKGVLTVRLALFYLCLMAGYGSADIRTRYPKLDTWHKLADGTFQHNTSGFTKGKLSAKDKEENPNSKEDLEEFGEEMEDADYDPYGEGAAYERDLHAGEEGCYVEGQGGMERGEEEDDVDQEATHKDVATKEKETGGTGDERLPTLSSSKPIKEVQFELQNENHYFVDRKGKKVQMITEDWTAMKYKGRRVMVHESKKTCYIAEKLPT